MRGTSLAAAACVVAACTGGGALSGSAPASATSALKAPAVTGAPARATTPAGPATRYPSAAWPEFDQNAQRTGIGPRLPTAGKLTHSWTARLDGAVYGQPLVVGGDVIAATENDSVYAISRATGKTVWRAHVGTPVPRSALHGCGDIFPLGITGTPIYDQGNGLVYAVAETTGYQHVLFGLAVADGKVEVERDLDLTTKANEPAWNQQHRRRAGLRRVRRAGGRLRRLHRRRRRGRPQRQRPAAELAHPDQPGGRRLGHRRPGRGAEGGPVGLERERRGGPRRPLRRERLGHRPQPGVAP
jgi:hypothetical protein